VQRPVNRDQHQAVAGVHQKHGASVPSGECEDFIPGNREYLVHALGHVGGSGDVLEQAKGPFPL
jgi:hypothetical protein